MVWTLGAFKMDYLDSERKGHYPQAIFLATGGTP